MPNSERKQPRPPVQTPTIPQPDSLINITGVFETTDTAPTAAPRTLYESIKIVVDSISSPTTRELYIYSKELSAWLKVTLSTV